MTIGHLEIRTKDFHTSCTDCSHTSKCNLKLRRLQPLSVCVYRLHAFPSALGFIPCSLSGLHFYGPRIFFFFFFSFENRMKEKKKKKSLRIGLLGLSAPASSYFLFSFSLSLSPPLASWPAAVLAQSNPATGSEPEFDARNRTPFVSQACSEALCTCHT